MNDSWLLMTKQENVNSKALEGEVSRMERKMS